MSPDGSITPPPEEKLLRLIRAKGPKPAEPRSSQGRGGFGLASALGRTEPRLPWTKLAVWMLSLLLGAEVVALVLYAMRPLPAVSIPAAAEPAALPAAASGPAGPTLPSLAASASRPLFAVPAGAAFSSGAFPGGAGSPAPPSATAKAVAARLTLTGIVPGTPAQAIIEDTQTQKTYFLSVGQAVVEGAVLEQVLDNRVVLDLQGEKIELTL